jgi:hypothetical protein
MNSPKSPADEFRQQRHEFILAYYDMATKDLDRHLKIGWQSIAVIGGAIGSLVLGEEGKLPIPFAVTLAILVSSWGLANILDANYWAIRAIGFLSNVEAVYFSDEDRRAFNPYLGHHPPLKLMNSLKHQFNAVFFFVILSFLYYIFKIAENTGLRQGLGKFLDYSFVEFLAWELPLYAACGLAVLQVRFWRRRVRDYREFVTGSPGPGLVKARSTYRGVDLLPLDEGLVIQPDKVQEGTTKKIDTLLSNLNSLVRLVYGAAIGMTFVLFVLALKYSTG